MQFSPLHNPRVSMRKSGVFSTASSTRHSSVKECWWPNHGRTVRVSMRSHHQCVDPTTKTDGLPRWNNIFPYVTEMLIMKQSDHCFSHIWWTLERKVCAIPRVSLGRRDLTNIAQYDWLNVEVESCELMWQNAMQPVEWLGKHVTCIRHNSTE